MSKDIWKCPECETLNIEDNCLICGFEKAELDHSYFDNETITGIEVRKIKFSSAEKPIAEPVQIQPERTIDQSVWFCSKCGMKNTKDEHQCIRCGYKRLRIPWFVIGKMIAIIALVLVFYYFVSL